MISWCKPGLGFFKLNVDGSRSSNGMIGSGGVIRDAIGEWISGFMVNIGAGSVIQAETWGLYHGLQIASSLHINHLEVESDSACLVQLLQSDAIELHPLGTILMNCKQLLNQFDACQIRHIHREGNMVADILAKESIHHSAGICTFTSPPALVVEAVLDDILGVARPREVVNNG
ncbi:putative ribonuclease H-like domain-containing protein [Rosa chinensis]|uniref:Putative ribonuclease H-like domain-containing protein n=1 Tax=Rosa chinensis TaxID=74649 RepID=A0A2P6RUG2_ROSCH|nr:putative ribonuclease H-like domain-containing protein [Rosa chinensis]